MERITLYPAGRVLLLAASVGVCELAGIIGSLVTVTGPGSWYGQIAKPAFTPPGAVIGTIWVILYLMMGISLYLILEMGFVRPEVRAGAGVFAVQLGLNTAWSFLFFGLRSPLLGLAGIVLLWCAVLVTIRAFWRIRKAAGGLLIPYLAWVSFAGYLTYAIFVMNP
jgi:benzodiazapine receptor